MRALFWKYFTGKTSREEEAKIMDYVEASEQARHEFLAERKLLNAFIFHIYLSENATRKRQPVYVRMLRFAAFFALAFSIGWFVQLLVKADDGGMQTLKVRPGSCVELMLADGSHVWLNANTSFSYPASFRGKQRKVTLSGEGYFEVSPSDIPFVVQTEKYDVKALGTTFNINAYPENEAFTTSLLEGSVSIQPHDASGETILLRPDQYVSLIGNQFQKGEINDYNHFLWRNGILYFDEDTFHDIIKTLEKYFHLQIEIRTSTVMNKRYTGKDRQAEGVDHILRTLQKDVDFKYERSEDNQTIIIK